MNYREHEQLQQIVLRAERLRRRKDLRRLKHLSATSITLLCVLLACIGRLGQTGYVEARSVYGAFLLSAKSGSYVVVATLAFALGVALTLLCSRHYKHK